MNNYYEHINDFGEMKAYPKPEIMPKDVKRLFKHCDNEYYIRPIFFSESSKKFYLFHESENYVDEVYSRKRSPNASPTFYFIPDFSYKNKFYIHDCITVSKQFLNRIKNMNKIYLENARKKL
mgnify:FL=1